MQRCLSKCETGNWFPTRRATTSVARSVVNKSCPDPAEWPGGCPNAAVPAQLSGCELVELSDSVVATPE